MKLLDNTHPFFGFEEGKKDAFRYIYVLEQKLMIITFRKKRQMI